MLTYYLLYLVSNKKWGAILDSKKIISIVAVLVAVIGALAHTGTAEAATAQKITWGKCAAAPEGIPDGGQKCATLQVPVDYSQPQGRTLDVAISRIAAPDQSKKRGVLLFNPGGPGGSGLDMPRFFATILPQEITSQYDLIGFDPRGVGDSTPVSCGLSEADAFRAFTPMELPGGFDATAAFLQRVAHDCAAMAGPNMPFMTTNNTARDMDQIRQALGAQKISYLGYSYGTKLGAAYASLFADKTDRIVLDSSVDPNKPWRDQFMLISQASEERFGDFAAFLVANNSTFNLGKSEAEIRKLYAELITYFNEHPTAVGEDFLPQGVPLTGEVIRRATFGGLYSNANFSYLADSLVAVKQIKESNGKATAAKKKAAAAIAGLTPEADNNVALGFSVICNDDTWTRSLNQYKKDAGAYDKQYPIFGKVGAALWPCAFWPQTYTEPPARATPGGPQNILIAQNLRDPATPYEGALGMRRAFGERAKLVSVDAGGHGTYMYTNNMCGFNAVSNFLAYGTMPKADVYCPVESETQAKQKSLKTTGSAARDAALRELRKRL